MALPKRTFLVKNMEKWKNICEVWKILLQLLNGHLEPNFLLFNELNKLSKNETDTPHLNRIASLRLIMKFFYIRNKNLAAYLFKPYSCIFPESKLEMMTTSFLPTADAHEDKFFANLIIVP